MTINEGELSLGIVLDLLSPRPASFSGDLRLDQCDPTTLASSAEVPHGYVLTVAEAEILTVAYAWMLAPRPPSSASWRSPGTHPLLNSATLGALRSRFERLAAMLDEETVRRIERAVERDVRSNALLSQLADHMEWYPDDPENEPESLAAYNQELERLKTEFERIDVERMNDFRDADRRSMDSATDRES